MKSTAVTSNLLQRSVEVYCERMLCDDIRQLKCFSWNISKIYEAYIISETIAFSYVRPLCFPDCCNQAGGVTVIFDCFLEAARSRLHFGLKGCSDGRKKATSVLDKSQ